MKHISIKKLYQYCMDYNTEKYKDKKHISIDQMLQIHDDIILMNDFIQYVWMRNKDEVKTSE